MLAGGLSVAGGTFTGSTGPVVTSHVTLSSGTLNAPLGTLNVTGGNFTATGGTFNADLGTVTYSGDTSPIVSVGTGLILFYNFQDALTGGFPGGMPDFNSEEFKAHFAKMAEAEKKIRATASQKIGEVLTKEQNDAFEKLLGKTFDFSKLKPNPQPGAAPEADTPKAQAETPKPATPAKPKSKMRKDRSS